MRNESTHTVIRSRSTYFESHQPRTRAPRSVVHQLRSRKPQQHALQETDKKREPAKRRRLQLNCDVFSVSHRSNPTECQSRPPAQDEHIGVVLLDDLGRRSHDDSSSKRWLVARERFTSLLVRCNREIVFVTGRNQPLAEGAI